VAAVTQNFLEDVTFIVSRAKAQYVVISVTAVSEIIYLDGENRPVCNRITFLALSGNTYELMARTCISYLS